MKINRKTVKKINLLNKEIDKMFTQTITNVQQLEKELTKLYEQLSSMEIELE